MPLTIHSTERNPYSYLQTERNSLRVLPLTKFAQPNMRSASLGYSFYDEQRPQLAGPPYGSQLIKTTTTQRLDDTPTLRPYLNTFTEDSTLPNYYKTTTVNPTYPPTTISDGLLETTTRQTDKPFYNQYSSDYTTTEEPDYDDLTNTPPTSTSTTTTTTSRPYLHHKFAINNPKSQQRSISRPSFSRLSAATTKRPRAHKIKSHGYASSDQTNRPLFNSFKSTTTTTTTTEAPEYNSFTLNDDSPYFTGFTSNEDSSENDRPHFSRLISSSKSPSEDFDEAIERHKESYFDRKSNDDLKSNPSSDYDDEPTNSEDYDEDNSEKYSYREVKTFSDSFGSKPGLKYNKFSRLKVITRDKTTTTERPTMKKQNSQKSNNHYRPSSTKYSSVTEKPPRASRKKSSQDERKKNTKKDLQSRGNVKFLYDRYVYHPDESRIISTVYTRNGIPIKKDLDESPSYSQLRSQMYHYNLPYEQRQQLRAITSTPNSYAAPASGPFYPIRYSQPLFGQISPEVERFHPVSPPRPPPPPPPAPAQRTTPRPVPGPRPPPQETRYFQ